MKIVKSNPNLIFVHLNSLISLYINGQLYLLKEDADGGSLVRPDDEFKIEQTKGILEKFGVEAHGYVDLAFIVLESTSTKQSHWLRIVLDWIKKSEYNVEELHKSPWFCNPNYYYGNILQLQIYRITKNA